METVFIVFDSDCIIIGVFDTRSKALECVESTLIDWQSVGWKLDNEHIWDSDAGLDITYRAILNFYDDHRQRKLWVFEKPIQ